MCLDSITVGLKEAGAIAAVRNRGNRKTVQGCASRGRKGAGEESSGMDTEKESC